MSALPGAVLPCSAVIGTVKEFDGLVGSDAPAPAGGGQHPAAEREDADEEPQAARALKRQDRQSSPVRQDWQNAPVNFDPLESVLPAVRRNSFAASVCSAESSEGNTSALLELRVGRWAMNVVRRGASSCSAFEDARCRGAEADAATPSTRADSDGVGSQALREAAPVLPACARRESAGSGQRSQETAPTLRSKAFSRGSLTSSVSVSPSADISVQQFQADRRRKDDHCETVRKILARSRHGLKMGNPAAYQRVSDQSCRTWSLGQLTPRVFAALHAIVALWTSFYASYLLAFEDASEHCIDWSTLPDVVYLACTCSLLFTSYVDAGTYEIASLTLVIKKRLTAPSWWADLVSCVPGCAMPLLLLKLLLRLRHVLFVRQDCVGLLTQLPGSLRVSLFGETLRFTFLRLLLSVYLFAHLLGCLLHTAVVRPSSASAAGALPVSQDSGTSGRHAYVEALKLSMNMMFSGNVCAVGWEGEEGGEEGRRAVLFYVAVMPLVTVFITTISAEVILLAQRACVLESQQFERLAMVNEANRSLNLPPPLSRKILEYNLWLTRGFNIAAYQCLLKNSSRSAQIEVKLHLCAPFISTAPFLQDAPALFICELLEGTQIMAVCAGDIIFHIGDPGLGMYFIIRGSCEVLSAEGEQLSELCQGTYFGEIALISGSTRLATVVATSFMLMAFFDRTSFQDLISQHPEMLTAFVGHCSQYTGNLLTQQFIDRLGFFKESPHRHTIIERLTSRLSQRSIPPGKTVFEQGEKGESMFFVLHGALEVFRGAGGRIAELIDGAHFGELCLLTDGAERTATVKTRTACLLAELHRADFEEVMRDFPDDVLRLLVHAAKIQKSNQRSEERFRRISTVIETGAPPPGLLSRGRSASSSTLGDCLLRSSSLRESKPLHCVGARGSAVSLPGARPLPSAAEGAVLDAQAEAACGTGGSADRIASSANILRGAHR